MLHFMPSSPPTLPSLCPHSHTSCLPQLAVVLPLVLRCLSFLSCHRLPSNGISTYPPLAMPPPLPVPPLFFLVQSPLVCPGCLLCHLSSRQRLLFACATGSSHCTLLMTFVLLVVASPLIAPPNLVALLLLLCPSCATHLLWLVVAKPLSMMVPPVCQRLCHRGTLYPSDHPQAHLMPHNSPTHLPSWKPPNGMQIHGITSLYPWM
jgi:hypothetical protein